MITRRLTIYATVLGAVLAFIAAAGEAAAQNEPNEQANRAYRSLIRFITESDYPPFNYLDEDGTLTGFNVDMARAICVELDVTCDIRARVWNEHVPALKRGETDAVIASMAISPRALADVDFTDRYYFTPGRFAVRKGTFANLEVTPIGLESRRVGVIRGTAHEAYIKAFFRDCIIDTFESAETARDALKDGKVEVLFDDAISLSLWMNGTDAKGCCEFRGGAFNEPVYFGDGVGIAIRKGDRELKRLLDAAIKRVRESGRQEEIFVKYFPLKAY